MIKPRNNRVEERPYDKEVYKRRNVIERFFHRLKQYRRGATRYDKYANRYLGFVYFAALLITAKKNVNTTYLFFEFTIVYNWHSLTCRAQPDVQVVDND